MIVVPNQDGDPIVAGSYVIRLRGSPLFLVAYWSGEYWLRGAEKIHGGVPAWAGPLIAKGKDTDD